MKLNTTATSLSLGHLGIAALAFAMAPGLAAQSTTHSVTIKDAQMDVVPAPIVQVSQSGFYNTMVGDMEGDCPVVNRSLTIPTVVRIEEVPALDPWGGMSATTIGQHFTYLPDGDDLTSGHRLQYHPPVGIPVSLDSFSATQESNQSWAAAPTSSSSYSFNATIAELQTKEIISNYTAFELGLHVDLFQHGLLIRCDNWVVLGDAGIVFRVNREGYSYGGSTPAVFNYSLSNPNFQSFAPAQVTGLDNTDIEFLITGFLAPGDNLFMLLDENPGGIYTADPLGVEVALAADPSCTPPPPTCPPAGACLPKSPSSGAFGGLINCSEWYGKIGNPTEADCGTGITQQECTTYKGGVSIGGDIGPIEVKINGEIGGRKCLNVSTQGGYRAQGYQCFTICCRMWEWEVDPWFSSPYTASKETCCSVTGQSSTTSCQFKRCP